MQSQVQRGKPTAFSRQRLLRGAQGGSDGNAGASAAGPGETQVQFLGAGASLRLAQLIHGVEAAVIDGARRQAPGAAAGGGRHGQVLLVDAAKPTLVVGAGVPAP